MNKLILICFISFSIVSLQAQTVIEFIEMAKAYNPTLKALKLEYEAALKIADQKTDFPDPIINLGIGVLPVETRLGAQRFKIGGMQPIPWKGLLNARKNLALAQAETKEQMDEVKEIEIEYMIRNAYGGIVFMDQKKEIINDKILVLDGLEALSKTGVRSGKGKLSNVLFVERTRESLTADLQLIEKQKESYAILLNRFAGRPFDTLIEIDVPEKLEYKRTELIQYATTNYPEIVGLENMKSASLESIELTKLEQKPQIGVGLEYGYIASRKNVELPGNGRDVLIPMGSISIPLNVGRYKAKRDEEKLRMDAIDARINELKDNYQSEISRAISELEYNEMVISKFNNLKEITKETLELLRTEYASEGTRFEELLRLEMELVDYESELIMARYKNYLAKSILLKFKK